MKTLDFNGGSLLGLTMWAMALMAPRGRSAARAAPPAEEEVEEETGTGEDGEPLGIVQFEDNLDDVEKPKEVPPGRYIGEVQDVQIKTSGAGNRYYAIKIVVPSDELPANVREEYEDGWTTYWNRQVVPKGKDRRALWNLKLLLAAMGLDTNVTSVDPNGWMGASIGLRVIHETYKGNTRAQIRSVEPAEPPAAPARGQQGGRSPRPKR